MRFLSVPVTCPGYWLTVPPASLSVWGFVIPVRPSCLLVISLFNLPRLEMIRAWNKRAATCLYVDSIALSRSIFSRLGCQVFLHWECSVSRDIDGNGNVGLAAHKRFITDKFSIMNIFKRLCPM
jgi:hypothetical protein